MTSDEQVKRVALAIHKAMAPQWMTVANALGREDRGDAYEALLNELARAAISRMTEENAPTKDEPPLTGAR